jgi:hypothetical protein
MLGHFSNNSIDNSLLDMLHNVSYKKKGREEKIGVYLLLSFVVRTQHNVNFERFYYLPAESKPDSGAQNPFHSGV